MSIILKHIKGKNWELAQNAVIELTDGSKILIPKGFETDLSSSPRFLWSIFPPYGDFLTAAIVHDYLYVSELRGRKFADYEMLRLSNKMNANKVDNYIRFAYVRLLGWFWYYGYYRRLKNFLKK